MHEKSVLDTIVTIILVAICVGLAVVVACSIIESGNTESSSPPEMVQNGGTVVNVSVETVERGPFTKTTTLGADIQGSMDVLPLTSTIAGKLTALDIGVGQIIRQGDAIGVVDPSTPGNSYKPSAIIAAIGGTVYSVDSYAGAQITTSTTLATLGGAGGLEVVTRLPERYLSTVEQGMKASFTTEAWGDESFAATVKRISPTVDSANRTFGVTLSIDETDSRLKEGMYVRLSLVTERIDDCVTVPTDAISTYLGEPVVFIVENERAKRIFVTTSSSDDNRSVVTSGLNGGEQLVTAGSVVDGSYVKIVGETL